MEGELGPVVAMVWNGYVIGVYATLQYAWALALGSLAIRRVQKIPPWAATVTMLVSFGAG